MKRKNLNFRELLTKTCIAEMLLTQEKPAPDYHKQKLVFVREFGSVMNENQLDQYLDFLFSKVSDC